MFIRFMLCFSVFALFTSIVQAGSKDDPIVVGVEIDRLEIRDPGGDDGSYLEGEASIGRDAYEFIVKAEIEREHGLTDESEIQVLYSVPISTYWDMYAGIRKDFKPDPSRTWGVLAIDGLAPGFIEVDASVFLGESGRTALRIEAEHEIALTDYWTLIPEIEVYVSGQSDEVMEVGSGLSEIEASLLLSYERHPKFVPYIGVNWTKVYGESADYAEEEGEDDSETVFVVGASAAF